MGRIDVYYGHDRDNFVEVAIAWIIVLILMIIIGGFIYLKLARYDTNATITSMHWVRYQPVEMFKTLTMDTQEYQMPSDAFNIRRYTRSHEESYSCGKKKTCYETVHEDWAIYNINRWVFDHNLIEQGEIDEPMRWPFFAPGPAQDVLGAVRATQRYETLYTYFKTPEAKAFTYSTGDETDWHRFYVGQNWSFQVNRMEEPQWESLKLNDKR